MLKVITVVIVHEINAFVRCTSGCSNPGGGCGEGASGLDRSKGNGPVKSVTFSVWTTPLDSVFSRLFFTKEQQTRSWWAWL